LILVTGGLGFLGLNTALRFVAAGEEIVLTQHRSRREPEFIADEVGRSVFIEQLDVTDFDSYMALGRKYDIDGILHLASPGYNAPSPADDYRVNIDGLLSTLRAAEEWRVKRLGLATSITVYRGQPRGPFREDDPLRMIGDENPVETYKKAFEVLGHHYAQRTGLEIVMLRIAVIYGPLHSLGNPVSRLCRAAVDGAEPELLGDLYEEDETDLCYVEDCADALARIQLAPELPNSVYNIGAGRAYSYREVAQAIRRVIPDARVPLKPGRSAAYRADPYMDVSRLKWDLDFEPSWSLEGGIDHYIQWLRHHPE
jgi:UDP-glucose 4-epimerase